MRVINLFDSLVDFLFSLGFFRDRRALFRIAQDVQQFVRIRMPEWKMQYEGVENLSLAVMGCVVNGPGEALMTDIGFTGGGAGSGMIYLAGKQSHKQSNAQMVDHIVELVEKRAAELDAAASEAAE